jgi:diguanylate cyclase (GGDEF)-like protein/putative nucleotidyltransferase with HDIG domain
MLSSTPLSSRGRLYVACVVLAGTAALAESVLQLYKAPLPWMWFVFAALTLFSGTFAIKVPSIPARISVSETFVFTAVLLFGTAAGTIVVALDGFIVSIRRKNRRLHRTIFNVAEPALSIWLASHLFFLLAGVQPLAQQSTVAIAPLVLPLLVFTVVYFLLNSGFTAVAVSLETGIKASQVWRQHFLWISLNYFGGASVAILLARNASQFDYSSLSVIVPLLVISYLTFKTAMQRVEDARTHVDKLNSLYLSTIETFAMWIDAKDQVTHGHIRRVQRYAVGLATELGVQDDSLVKAIEAAALLHDMGKLAVPEHILNKPGKLTAGEFEKMKLHASVGAQILSSIDFPYPVVPIVRHHHENWDGKGYPDRLAGTDIPIGARILAVVDCFDALTSDRPYRPKLGDQDAIEILLARRGTMYDPLVVDGFLKVHSEMQQEADSSPAPVHYEPQPSPRLADSGAQFLPTSLRDTGDSVLTLFELARNLAGHAGVDDTAAVIVRHLTELVPAQLSILFIYEPETDEIVAAYASGSARQHLKGMRLRLGAGVSGWVAANRRSAANCDARLELGRLAVPGLDHLTRAYSTPLVVSDTLVGVLTLYADNPSVFSETVLRTVDLLNPHISQAVKEAIDFESQRDGRIRDKLTGLPQFASFSQLVTVAQPSRAHTTHPLVVVFVDIDRLKAINDKHGVQAGDDVLRHVTRMTREILRAGDLLLRYGSDEFVVLLGDTDSSTAEAVALRIVATVSNSSLVLRTGETIYVRLLTGFARAPVDGSSLEDLVDVARNRATAQPDLSTGTNTIH